jgi:MinD superfamily P-loop ATPase
MLGLIKAFPKPAEAVASNFYAQVDDALCAGCETCATRCPIEAIALTNGSSTVDLKRCIGCGLCVPTCPEDAVHLVRKVEEVVPPLTEEDHLELIVGRKDSLGGKVQAYSLKTLLRVMSRFSGRSASNN